MSYIFKSSSSLCIGLVLLGSLFNGLLNNVKIDIFYLLLGLVTHLQMVVRKVQKMELIFQFESASFYTPIFCIIGNTLEYNTHCKGNLFAPKQSKSNSKEIQIPNLSYIFKSSSSLCIGLVLLGSLFNGLLNNVKIDIFYLLLGLVTHLQMVVRKVQKMELIFQFESASFYTPIFCIIGNTLEYNTHCKGNLFAPKQYNTAK